MRLLQSRQLFVGSYNYFWFSGSPPVSQDEVEGIGFARDLTASVLLSVFIGFFILGDPGADSGGEGKSKRAGKNMARRKVKNG